MKKIKTSVISISFLIAFVVWTLLLCFVDVKSIGPNNSKVGFATINYYVHKLTGENLVLYVITDWLGLVPIAFSCVFAFLGLVQWIKRKKILKVDKDILSLGLFYVIVFSLYVMFEYVVINYRPILINGILEASYPSSTTLLVTCVMPTVIIQINKRIKKRSITIIANLVICAFISFMIIGRLLSGFHWASDIIGGILLSIGLVVGYYHLIKNKNNI